MKMWGMGDAMRRRSILRVGRAISDKDPETASLLDIGCGTGRFLTFVKVRKGSLLVCVLFKTATQLWTFPFASRDARQQKRYSVLTYRVFLRNN